MNRLIGILLAANLCGCAATYTKTPVAEAQIKLQSGTTVAIATPQDGAYNGKPYAQSGPATANAVRAAFARYAVETIVVPGCETPICLREKAPAATYLVVPEILHWEDRATEWSGKKDKLELKLTVYSAERADVVASTVLSGRSKWATFGGDHPQDLLPEPINEYVATLY